MDAAPCTMLRPPFLLLAALAAVALGGCGNGDRGAYVGTWRPATADSLGTRTTFFADGTARIIRHVPLGEPQAFDARFDVSGDTLLTLSDPQGAERFRVRLDGDTLRLWSPDGGPETVWVRL